MDSYFLETIDFCRAWLSGQQYFTIHTSGSTGAPKPISVSRAQMQASAQATAQALGLHAGDTALVCLNTAYIAGKMMLVRGMEVGMNMIVVPPSANPLEQLAVINYQLEISDYELIISNFQFLAFNKFMIINYINNQQTINHKLSTINHQLLKIDFFSFVPLQMLTILKSEITNLESEVDNQQLTINNQKQKTNKEQQTINHKLSTINHELLNHAKAIIIGGAPVNAELEVLLQSLIAPAYATYGMTETVSHIALKQLNGKEKTSYYQVLPNTMIGQDARGCLTIVSPVTNFKKIITNDKVNLIDDTHFEWLGRVDNVVNSGGVKIQVEKIEREIDAALFQLNISQRFVVLGLPDEALGEKLVLVIEGTEAEQKENDLLTKINASLKENLTKYELPKNLFFLPQFPQTATNKINRLEISKWLAQ